MAKRKRLTPPDPAGVLSAGLETKSALSPGLDPLRPVPPIASEAAHASGQAALAEMARALEDARTHGTMVIEVPLDQIEAGYLVRDRSRVDAEEMDALVNSIAARGQQTPVELVQLGPDRYGLISGWRRLTALRRLRDEMLDLGLTTVRALLRRPRDSAEAYIAMVEETEVRVGLSHYERARIVARAVEQGVFETHKKAAPAFFAHASRARRSKIRAFLVLVDQLDDTLRFPEQIGERLGLRLASALEADAALAERLRKALKACDPADAEAEKACLEAALKPVKGAGTEPDKAPKPQPDLGPAEVEEPQPGLILRREAGGRISIFGPAVTDELQRKLHDFLAGLQAR